MNRLLTALILVTLGLPSAVAQTSSDNTAIQALLVEVRQLRLALERSAVVSPKIQVTLQRMQLQQDHVLRLERQLEDLRSEIAHFASEDAKNMAQVKTAEAHVAQEQDAARRKAMEQEIRMLKARFEQESERQKLDEAQRQAREIELAGRLQTEQAKLNELSDKLNVLERLLDGPPKQP